LEITTLTKGQRVLEHNCYNYEEHVLFGLNQIYYWVLKCTTCFHYTNIIKSGLINLIKIGTVFTTGKGLAY
jgi:hypothetical protein